MPDSINIKLLYVYKIVFSLEMPLALCDTPQISSDLEKKPGWMLC